MPCKTNNLRALGGVVELPDKVVLSKVDEGALKIVSGVRPPG
jgi:hypothetical protein